MESDTIVVENNVCKTDDMSVTNDNVNSAVSSDDMERGDVCGVAGVTATADKHAAATVITREQSGDFSHDASSNGAVAEAAPTENTKVGFAKIKAEYLDADHQPQIAAHLPSDATREILEPQTKRVKLKGRNKDRPRAARLPNASKLCVSVTIGETCAFGDQCRYLHDISAYIASKPADIADTCYLFQTYGHCRFGVTCRYAKHHITDDFKNIATQSDDFPSESSAAPLNTMTADLQKLLWKKQYDFSSATAVSKKDDQSGTEVKDSGTEKPSSHAKKVSDDNSMKTEECRNATHRQVKHVDFADKLYLAPLTTVGNLPFRRLCKRLGADITCGEMALAANLLQGKKSEWALLKRHPSEDIFGVQICGSHPDMMTRCAQLLTENTTIDFIDINCGCPLDAVVKKGEGCGLMGRSHRLERVVETMTSLMDVPLTVKMRTGIYSGHHIAHKLIPKLSVLGVGAVTLHGRSREQRYTRLADWGYIDRCAQLAAPMMLFGNGDILSFEDANLRRRETSVAGMMIARGALIKPWIFTEIKEQRHWDISSAERLGLLQDFTNYGLEHWGSDQQGVDNTRRFLLEWLSFLYRYIPVGVLEHPPQKINEKPPYYVGRDHLETMMASANCADWIKISEMLLGPVPDGFTFLPKHKANSYK